MTRTRTKVLYILGTITLSLLGMLAGVFFPEPIQSSVRLACALGLSAVVVSLFLPKEKLSQAATWGLRIDTGVTVVLNIIAIHLTITSPVQTDPLRILQIITVICDIAWMITSRALIVMW